jgi:hypothetical protein
MVVHIRGYGDGSIVEDNEGYSVLTLKDAPFSSTFIYDTDVGVDTSGIGTVGRLGGIAMTSAPDPVQSAVLQIRGFSFQFSDGLFQGDWQKDFAAGGFGLDAERDDAVDAALRFSLSASGLTADPAQAFGSNGGTGQAHWSVCCGDYFETAGGASLKLRVTRFDVEPLAQSSGALAAPEPLVWVELLVGFAGVGAALRSLRARRRPGAA